MITSCHVRAVGDSLISINYDILVQGVSCAGHAHSPSQMLSCKHWIFEVEFQKE